MEKVDTVKAYQVIDRCLDYWMDLRFTQAQRSKFLSLAKRLRGSLLNLLSARFDEGTAALTRRTASWRKQYDAGLKKFAETLANAAETLANLIQLVGALNCLG